MGREFDVPFKNRVAMVYSLLLEYPNGSTVSQCRHRPEMDPSTRIENIHHTELCQPFVLCQPKGNRLL